MISVSQSNDSEKQDHPFELSVLVDSQIPVNIIAETFILRFLPSEQNIGFKHNDSKKYFTIRISPMANQVNLIFHIGTKIYCHPGILIDCSNF